MPDPLRYFTGQTVDTTLSPNCNAKTNATFDINDSTWVTIYTGTIPLWVTLLSIANQRVSLLEPITSGPVTLCEGLTTTLNPLGTSYTVMLSGSIKDGATTYKYDGLLLGIFTRNPAAKQAMRSLRAAMASDMQQKSRITVGMF